MKPKAANARKRGRKKPETIKEDNVSVPVYKSQTRGYPLYTVAWYQNGKRIRKRFSDHSEAVKHARTVAEAISTGEQEALKLTNKDQAEYQHALELLKPLGVPLAVALHHYVEAVGILDGEDRVIEAARHYKKSNLQKIPVKRVHDVVEELLQAKRADGLSDRWIGDLTSRLGKFRKRFDNSLGSLTGQEIDQWLRVLKVSPRTRNNFRTALQTLATFAIQRGYLPKDWSELDAVALAKERGGAIEIFTPEEIGRLLQAADERLRPFLAIGAFAGLRHAEIERLEWSEVKLTEGHIIVAASKAKTAQRRIVPIVPNLSQWLAPIAQKSGPVCPLANIVNPLVRLCERTKTKEQAAVTWKHNGLRHSFISYRVAELQNVAQVALEAGNSPSVIFSNYRELVTPAEAKRWFSIEPSRPGNIIAKPHAA